MPLALLIINFKLSQATICVIKMPGVKPQPTSQASHITDWFHVIIVLHPEETGADASAAATDCLQV